MVLLVVACDKVREAVSSGIAKPDPSILGKFGPGQPVATLAASQFDAFINQPGRLIVVDFYADWCPPCRELGPVLERVTAEFGDAVRVGKINVDNARELAAREGVRGIPDVRFYRDGERVHQFTGSMPEGRLRGVFQNLTKDHQPASSGGSGVPVDGLQSGSPMEVPGMQRMPADWTPPGIERSGSPSAPASN